jgi:hypothetical protein
MVSICHYSKRNVKSGVHKGILNEPRDPGGRISFLKESEVEGQEKASTETDDSKLLGTSSVESQPEFKGRHSYQRIQNLCLLINLFLCCSLLHPRFFCYFGTIAGICKFLCMLVLIHCTGYHNRNV